MSDNTEIKCILTLVTAEMFNIRTLNFHSCVTLILKYLCSIQIQHFFYITIFISQLQFSWLEIQLINWIITILALHCHFFLQKFCWWMKQFFSNMDNKSGLNVSSTYLNLTEFIMMCHFSRSTHSIFDVCFQLKFD